MLLGGTDHPIIKADNWLQQHDLKLSDLEKYYEIAWNPGLGVHVCKTISQKHFIDISNALITHCTGALSRSHNHPWHMVANISLFADLTFMIDVSNGLWFDRFVSVFLNTSANKLAFTSKCVTAFLHVLQSATGEMELQQSTEWAGNKDVYVMDIRDEDHAQDVLGQVAPIFEKYDVVMSTMMATC